VIVSGSVDINTGACIYTMVYPIVAIIFGIADFFLSLAMLIVFLVPLWGHGAAISELGNQKEVHQRLRSVIQKNMIFSTVALAGGSLSLICFSTLMWIAVADGTPETYYLRFWALFSITFDSTIGIIAVHAMTNGWQPNILQNCLSNRNHLCSKSNGSNTGRSAPVEELGSIRSSQLEGPQSEHHSASGEIRTFTLGLFKLKKTGKKWKLELSRITEENPRTQFSTKVSHFDTN
jgi:hypothetical protein